ncbi:hypothetical protein AG1IA_01925 [Rhizoctonia solani AG-1 IA]|uniref:Uncharacterized protein n=1 Tax=Thanatephorus cucumeris (strain AG1-IA) TaxID=983506 RepID=L8X1D7_THACA|nr:hypothetical protein AG1IA_01925 [Rhizoctonia solani AG-1 IA]
MKAFLGYPITKTELKARVDLLDPAEFRYVGAPDAETRYIWDIYDRFSFIGPFRLIKATVNDEAGYVCAVGWNDCRLERIPPLLLEWAERVFGGKPRTFTIDKRTRTFKSRRADGEDEDVVRDNMLLIPVYCSSNLDAFRWRITN